MLNFISVGIQAGRLNSEDRLYIIHNGMFFGLPLLAYSLWSLFLNGNTYDKAIIELGSLGDESIDFTKHCFDELKEAGLIASISEAVELIPYRQGVGIGFDEKTSQYVVQCNSHIHLSFLSYALWCHADGKKSTSEIKNILRNQRAEFTDRDYIKAYFTLLKTDALSLA